MWYRSAIAAFHQGAYSHLTGKQRQRVGIRAHDIRGVGTTWAGLASVPFKEIMDAAAWSRAQTFTRFYLKDLPATKGRFSRSVLMTADTGSKNLNDRSAALDRMVVLCWATIIHSIYLRFMSGPSKQRCLFNFWSFEF